MAGRRSPLQTATAVEAVLSQDWERSKLLCTYGDAVAEYAAAKETAAVHNASYVGRIKATGADVLDLLNRLSTNAVDTLAPGQGAPTILTTDRGRVFDLIFVANRGDYVLLLTSANMAKDVMEWIDKYTFVEDVTLEDITALTAMVSIIGPGASDLLGRVTGIGHSHMEPYGSASVSLGGIEVLLLRHDLAHLSRFELVVPQEQGEGVWRHLVGAGAIPVGLEAYQALRVELGIPLHGMELDESYNPLEAGLDGAISFAKGCYIGQEVIARLDTYRKVQRMLVSLSFTAAVDASPGTKLVRDGREVGSITSVERLPATGELVGLGYVRREAAETGMALSLVGFDGATATVMSLSQSLGPASG